MTVFLKCPIAPRESLRVETSNAFGGVVTIGRYRVSLEEFLRAAHDALTSTELLPNDPRHQFVECVRAMGAIELTPAYRKEDEIPRRKLTSPIPPVRKGSA